MHNIVFRKIARFRENYWFWPSTMTFVALVLGFALPLLDAWVGPEWIRGVGLIRPTQVDGARALLTTLAGATLGVAGVAFSVTIVAVSFASSNYGPRLIGNFMADKTNQIVLGVFVATFVYCITVLTTVHGRSELPGATLDAFVPQISVFFALVLTLVSIGALIGYIHHIPESINIMNLTATIGDRLQRSVSRMLDEEDRRKGQGEDAVDVEAWRKAPHDGGGTTVCAATAGYLQQVDLKSLEAFAHETKMQIVLYRAAGDFLVKGEPVMGAPMDGDKRDTVARRLQACYTQGSNRTDVQDILFLSDQLVEVLGRALSPGVNDPHTAIICLEWLRAGLVVFAEREPAQPSKPSDPVLYRRVEFEDMLDRSFDTMRQYVAADRNVTLHALDVLGDLASKGCRPAMAAACVRQMYRLAQSAKEVLAETIPQQEIEAALTRSLQAAAIRWPAVGQVDSRSR